MLATLHPSCTTSRARLCPRISAPGLPFEPSYLQADWHFGSEEYVALAPFGPHRVPTVKGVKIDDLWCYWTHDYNDSSSSCD